MALMHQTTMAPSKLELLAAWLPSQPWFSGDVSALESLGGFRLDDPAGEVGLEGMLLTAGDDTVYYVPLSYRGAPLEGGEDFLVGTSEHGVLGTRWISDAAGDPVYRQVIASIIAGGGRQAEEFVQDASGNRVLREPAVRVQGTGRSTAQSPELADATVEQVGALTRVSDDFAVLDIVRVLDPELEPREDQYFLRASWGEHGGQAILAMLYAG